MIANPCSYFINPSQKREFTYEVGQNAKPYHFSARNITGSFSVNVLFFADDIEQAEKIITDWLTFRINCERQYFTSSEYFHDELTERHIQSETDAIKVLSHKDKWVIQEAPKNQFYKISWAMNDNIL